MYMLIPIATLVSGVILAKSLNTAFKVMKKKRRGK